MIISPTPPSRFGPVHATTVARTPVSSSPAYVAPVTSQPAGSGQGTHTGTTACFLICCSWSGVGNRGGATG